MLERSIHPGYSRWSPDNAAQGSLVEGYSPLNASLTPRVENWNPGAAKHGTVTVSRKLPFDSNDLQQQSNVPWPSRNLCDLHWKRVSLPQGPAPNHCLAG